MAAKKKSKKKAKSKSKPKAKTKKKLVTKRAAPQKTKRSKAVKKKAVKKSGAKKKSTGGKSVAKKKSAPVKTASAPVVPAGEVLLGKVTHYYSHLMVAVVQVEAGMLREGDTIHIKGHTSDFRQRVGSLELNHVHVASVGRGESAGLKVNEHAREHDMVYLVTNPT